MSRLEPRDWGRMKEYVRSYHAGTTAEEWLALWDAGQVWSIVLGGMGDSYERCIQATAAEFIRVIVGLDCKRHVLSGNDREFIDEIETEVLKHPVARLSSGMQFNAAKNLAHMLLVFGTKSFNSVPDRIISVENKP